MALYSDIGKCEGCVYCQTVMISVAKEMELFQKCFNSRFNKKNDEAWERPNAGCCSAWADCKGRKEYE